MQRSEIKAIAEMCELLGMCPFEVCKVQPGDLFQVRINGHIHRFRYVRRSWGALGSGLFASLVVSEKGYVSYERFDFIDVMPEIPYEP